MSMRQVFSSVGSIAAIVAVVVGSQVPQTRAQDAIAQNSTEQESASSASDSSNADNPQTPAGTATGEQQTNQPVSENQSGEQGQSENENRSGSNNRQSADGSQRTNQDQQSSDRQNRARGSQSRDNNRSQANNQRDSREDRQGGDWRSDIRFGEPTHGGLAIVNVERGTSFYHSGLRQGDVVISYDGRPIRSEDDFGRWAIYRPGQRVPVIVLRDGRRETVYITYDEDRNQLDPANDEAQQSYDSQAFLGVRFEPRMRGAAVISSVIPGSPAEEAGLQKGDELLAINGREIGSAREATRTIASMQPGDRVDIEFSRPMNQKTQAVLEGRPDESQTAQNRGTEVQVFRGGPDYDRMNQSESGQATMNQSTGPYDRESLDSNVQGSQRDSNRRGGGLLPRLRN